MVIKRSYLYYFFFLYFSLLQFAMGQAPSMWHITDIDGLPSQTVYHTVQDSKGYVWIATSNGICRFDGKNFKSYQSTSLNDNEILKVDVDPIGRIWFNNLSGQLFYIENEVIHDVQDLLNEETQLIRDFAIDGHSIWISLINEKKQGIYFTIGNLPFNEVGIFSPIFEYKEAYSFTSSFVLESQSAYISMRKEKSAYYYCYQMNKEAKELIKIDSIPYEHAYSLRFFFKYREKKYIQNSKIKSKYLLKTNNGHVDSYFELDHSGSINHISVVDDSFWILTRQGIVIIPIDNPKPERKEQLLDNISTNHMMIDDEGNKWISTASQGIYVINAPQIRIFQKNNYPLPSNEIYSLEYNKFHHQLWLGHNEGKISIIDDQFNNHILAFNSTGRVVDIMVDHNYTPWCVHEKALIRLNADLTQKIRFNYSMKTILESKENEIFLGTSLGVLRIPEDKLDSLDNKHSMSLEKISYKKTYSILQSFSDEIWLGTTKGIFIYNDTLSPYLEKENQVAYNVSSMTQTPDSVIWVATRGDGLIGIKNHQILYRYNYENGIASNTVKKVFATKDHLWVGTDNGLNKLDLATKKWEWINKSHGLPSNEINAIEVVEDQVWIGTPKGLANFSAHAIHANYIPPQMHITAIQLEEKDTLVLDSFFLPHDQNSIQIEFAGIGFRGKGKMFYQYKMSGIDEKWVNTESRFARYPKLPPGEYLFEVFAINKDHIKSKHSAKVSFFIQAPWWQTWWFRFLCALGFVSAGAMFLKVRLQRQKQEQLYLRLIFEQSQYAKITLEEELEFLNLYLKLEKLRFMDEIDIQFVVSPELLDLSDEIHLPPLLIQPIIENSFKHGFLYREGPGILKINFSIKEAFIICTIQDNGVGRKKATSLGQQPLKDRPSSGLKTAKERLNINNLGHQIPKGENTGVEIIDLHDDNNIVTGTLVILKIYCSELANIEN